MSTWIFEQNVEPSDVKVEDSGQAKITEFSNADATGIFVRVQSWAENGKHPDFDQMVGTRVRITIETF